MSTQGGGSKKKGKEEPSFFARIASFFKRKDPRTPVKGFLPRIKSLGIHYRGLLGVIVPLVLLSWQPSRGRPDITVGCLWFWMFWFFLLQPVNVPVVGFIPLFLLPMAGVMPTVDVCRCYFDDNLALFVLGGMIHLLLNSCGADRRIILWLLCSGDSCQFSGKRMIFKASAAAFFMSMMSNRLIVSSTIIQLLAPAYTNLQSYTARQRSTEPNYESMRYIVICAVQTASNIGSIAILHASFATLAMRAIWSSHPPQNEEFPDIFNYLQYTCFAFPVAFMMFIFNFVYYMVLINWLGKPMSGTSMVYMRNMLLEQDKLQKPYLTAYQKWCIFFYFAFLAACIFRWSDWLNMGWSGFKTIVPEIPLIKDATVAAIFVILLHILPKTFLFTNYVTARVKSHIGDVLKPDSPVMWWRYVDKNTNYGYIILIGGSIALNIAIRVSNLNEKLPDYGKHITKLDWWLSVLVVCAIATILPNAMSSVAACCVLLPFVLHMAPIKAALRQGAPQPPAPGGSPGPQTPAAPVVPAFFTAWSGNYYIGALAVGIGSSFGFASPFLYTPAYFCHFTGKVPKVKMLKLTVGSAVICIIVLWFALCFYAPVIWVDKTVGIRSYVTATVVTIAAPGGAPAPSPAPSPSPP